MLSLTIISSILVSVIGEIPSQVHIAFSGQRSDGSPDGMSIGWYSTANTLTTTIQYGVAGAGLTMNKTTPGGLQYLADFGYHHEVVLTELQPKTKYVYRIGDDASGWTQTFQFTSAPAAQDVATPFGVSMFGDMGWLGGEQRKVHVPTFPKNWSAVDTRVAIEGFKNNKKIDFLWHLGDIAYADDAYDTDPLNFNYEQVYSGFMNWFQNISSIMPYMVSVGNHESECHSPSCVANGKAKDLRNFTAYNARYHMPSSASGGRANMWYSFNYGPVHFVSANTETDFAGAGEENTGDSGDKSLPAGHFGRDGEYLEWLEADLKAANATRDVRPWIVVGGHRPFMSLPDSFPQLLEKYNVDIYACGHTHSYKRMPPTGGAALNEHEYHASASTGLTEIIVGGAGCDEMPNVGVDNKYTTTSLQQSAADPTPVYSTALLASGVLTVVNSSALQWQLISSQSGIVLDELWLTK